MTPDTLHVSFGSQTVAIRCDVPVVHATLARVLRHSLGAAGTAGVTYQIKSADRRAWALWRGDQCLYQGHALPYVFALLLHNMATALTAHNDDQPVLHAAGLRHADQGILMCGKSGSGKSTLAAWLVACGFDYMTDELVAVGKDRVQGWQRPLVLKGGSRFVWERWLAPCARHNLLQISNGAVWLDPELLRPGALCTAAAPGLILFIRYAADQPLRGQPLSKAETLFRLLNHVVNTKILPRAKLTSLARLAERTPAYELTYSELDAVVAWLRQTL